MQTSSFVKRCAVLLIFQGCWSAPGLLRGEEIRHELVPVHSLPNSPLEEIRYATQTNFTGQKLYPFPAAYVRKEVAEALSAVQNDLANLGLGLKIYDGYRPLSVQQKMWDLIQDERYVSNPAKNRGRHTRGTAVDVTLVDKLGKELVMPTDFDDFTEKAHSDSDDTDPEAKRNRKILQEVMTRHGFEIYPYEWWHFDFQGWQKFPALDVSFQELAGGEETTTALD